MYPFIGSISLLGIGMIISVIIFLYTYYLFSRSYSISYNYIIKNIGYLLVFSYMLASYSYYLIEEFIVFPLHWKQLLLYFSPLDFNIHIIGLIIAIIIIFFQAEKQIINQNHIKLFHSAFFDAFMLSSIIFGLFLVLDDGFFSISNLFIKLQSLTVDSDRAAFDHVFPLGFLVSVGGLVLYSMMVLLRHKGYYGYEYFGRVLWFLMMFFITLIQHYPRHLVLEIGGVHLDIKQYFFCILAIVSFYKFYKENIV